MDRADVLLGLGHLGDAREVLESAIRDGEASRNSYALGAAHVGFGAAAIELGDFVTAGEHLRKAVAQFQAFGDTSMVMKTRTWLVNVAVATGDYAAGKREEHEILRFYGRTGEPPEQYMAHRSLAAIAVLERDWPAASREIAAARALARRYHQATWEESLTDDEGRLALLRGDLALAERKLDYLLRGLEDSSSHQQLRRYGARIRLADIYARRGELDRAEREASTAADRLDAWRATLAGQPQRMLAFQARQTAHFVTPPLQDDQQESMARVIAALAAGGRIDAAFQLAERRRARELLDQLLQADASRVRRGQETQAGAGSGRVIAVSSAREIAGTIPDGRTAVVEYVGGVREGPVSVFVVQRSGTRAQVIPPPDGIGDRIGRLAALLNEGRDPAPLDRELGDLLLAPALELLDSAVTRLVIVPDGPLHRLPFDALRLPDGRLAVERFAIAIAPSAGVLRELWRRRPASANIPRQVRVLALGDPRFDRANAGQGAAAETFQAAFARAGGLPRLPASGEEARLVGSYGTASEVRLREDASEAYLKRTPLRGFQVLHFATHAIVDDRSVARTAIALTPGDREDGFLAPAELAGLGLDADLVVLSACRTAGGVVVAGEGVQGLTAPLLQAGARSVAATRWRISDRAARRLVEPFYGALADGLPVADALRAAKLAALRRGAPAREWASFTAVGDPLVRIPLRRPRSQWGAWAAGLLGAALLGALVYARKRGAGVGPPAPA